MIQEQKQRILEKLGIKKLNPMQERAYDTISNKSEIVLLSPTGSGKTLAFLLPLIDQLNPSLQEVQAMIIVPTRELAIQIEQVFRSIGSGFKSTLVYGGKSNSMDKQALKHPPSLLIGTPGRVADHIRRENIETNFTKFLVLDEFDKSLEIGFKDEMNEIVGALGNLEKKILTSATQKIEIPSFLGLKDPNTINFLGQTASKLLIEQVIYTNQNKLSILDRLLKHIGQGNGIVFCNFKNSIQELSDFLQKQKIAHVCFHGGLEQRDRENALVKFRNGSSNLLIATDLAARGIDIPEMDFIIHYELPHSQAEFTHRNGRSARMNAQGSAYVLGLKGKDLPDFIQLDQPIQLESKGSFRVSDWDTLIISGGRKDKISKGDIAGLFFKQGNLKKDELGLIELKQDCAFVAVPKSKSNQLVSSLNKLKLKKTKVQIKRLQ